MYKGQGIHHIAIGVRDLNKVSEFYRQVLSFNNIDFEFDDSPHEIMEGVVRTKPVNFAGIMFSQEPKGVLLELIQMSKPIPRPIRADFRYGDIGVAKMSIAVSNLEEFYSNNKDRINFCSKPKLAVIPGLGDYNFVFGKDPEGNLIEFFSNRNIKVSSPFGSFHWIGISVTDLERSMKFYQKNLGFDRVFIDIHDSFSGLVDEISGGTNTVVKSCVLANSNGGGMVELFEVVKPRGRSIPFGTIWGDFGYLQVCLFCKNIYEVVENLKISGVEFLSEIEVMDDGVPEHKGSFIYFKDPDGIPLELLFLHNVK